MSFKPLQCSLACMISNSRSAHTMYAYTILHALSLACSCMHCLCPSLACCVQALHALARIVCVQASTCCFVPLVRNGGSRALLKPGTFQAVRTNGILVCMCHKTLTCSHGGMDQHTSRCSNLTPFIFSIQVACPTTPHRHTRAFCIHTCCQWHRHPSSVSFGDPRLLGIHV